MDYEIVGRLLAQGNQWDLLELAPREIFREGVRPILRRMCVEFSVLENGEPQWILVYGGFVIIPKVEPEEEPETIAIAVDSLESQFADKFQN